MGLSNKVKTALDETRLLNLGAQVLLGFKLRATFQDGFSQLPQSSRLMDCLGQFLMALSVGLLIAPSMQNLIVERGQATNRLVRGTSKYAEIALFPFAISLGLSFYMVLEHTYGMWVGTAAGLGFCLLAAIFWYGLGLVTKKGGRSMRRPQSPTPLPKKIDEMLTEARVIIPGAQALFGFQLVVILTRSFSEISPTLRFLHVAALCLVALATILLMTPAALHRIGYDGEDTEDFLKRGSRLVVVAPIPLGLGIATDLYVATTQASHSGVLGAAVAISTLISLSALWYGIPLYIRNLQGHN